MTQQLLSKIDLEELRAYPFLWERYQSGLADGRVEGERQTVRDNLLEALALRFSLSIPAYRRLEESMRAVTDKERLNTLFRLSITAATLAEFETELRGEPVAPTAPKPRARRNEQGKQSQAQSKPRRVAARRED